MIKLRKAAEEFLAEAASGLAWVHRCVDEGRWGEAHAVAVTSTHLALCGCLALYGRLPRSTRGVERAFLEYFNGAALGIGPQLVRLADLRHRLDDTPWRPFTSAGWQETHSNVGAVLSVVLSLLPRQSFGRARLEAEHRALTRPRSRPADIDVASMLW